MSAEAGISSYYTALGIQACKCKCVHTVLLSLSQKDTQTQSCRHVVAVHGTEVPTLCSRTPTTKYPNWCCSLRNFYNWVACIWINRGFKGSLTNWFGHFAKQCWFLWLLIVFPLYISGFCLYACYVFDADSIRSLLIQLQPGCFICKWVLSHPTTFYFWTVDLFLTY